MGGGMEWNGGSPAQWGRPRGAMGELLLHLIFSEQARSRAGMDLQLKLARAQVRWGTPSYLATKRKSPTVPVSCRAQTSSVAQQSGLTVRGTSRKQNEDRFVFNVRILSAKLLRMPRSQSISLYIVMQIWKANYMI